MKWARFSPTDSEGRSNNSVPEHSLKETNKLGFLKFLTLYIIVRDSSRFEFYVGHQVQSKMSCTPWGQVGR